MKENPTANYNFQIAAIYGEKGELENMFNAYLDMIEINDNYLPSAKSYMGRYVTDDGENEANILLRNALIRRLQNNPQNSWNQLLSWLFMQQKDYDKALVQEKALYKRNLGELTSIIEVGKIAFNNKSYEVSKNCFLYHYIGSSVAWNAVPCTTVLHSVPQNSRSSNYPITLVYAEKPVLLSTY